MPLSSSGGSSYEYYAKNRTTRASRLRVAKYTVIVGVTEVCGVGREVLLHDFVTQSLTFEVSINACEWQPGVPQLEYHVSASEQGRQHARESRHMTRIP